MEKNSVETISSDGKVYAYLISKKIKIDKTTFLVPQELNLQVGFIVYSAGGKVVPHIHCPLRRQIVGTSEVLIIQKGQCEVDVYDDGKRFIGTKRLSKGDIIIFVCGGHGVRMLKDTVLLEVKQGPFTGLPEKERF